MNFKQLIDDERAVSPVIGVILMVAITVILAAVIGTFVLGLGDQVQSTTPQASFGFDFETGADANGDRVTVTHESGDSISGTELSISATTGINATDDMSTAWQTGSTSYTFDNWYTDVSAGSTVYVGGGDLNGETFRVIYNNPNSDSSSTLAKFEAPE